MFTNILVPTDFSEASDAALDYARVIAVKFGATVRLLHVLETPLPTAPPGSEMFISETPDLQARLFHDARSQLALRTAPVDRAMFHMTTAIITGASARTIIDEATKRGIDLIVMGTHGRSGIAHLLMGSVAEKVVRHAPCPVLTVRSAPIAERVRTTTRTRAEVPA